jgi:hypothetical protein
VDIKVTGAEEFGVLARRLKEAPQELRKELYAGINRSVKPLRQDVKIAAGVALPHRHGYAGLIASELKVTARRRAAGRNPAVYLVGKAGKRDVSSLNRGRLRHPLYGNRRHWYSQRIRPGFWTVTLEADAPRVRTELVEAIKTVARKIEAGIR